MIKTEFLNDGTLIKHYSDAGFMLLQVETSIKYADPIDVVPCMYTYEETDEVIEEDLQTDTPQEDQASDIEANLFTKVPIPNENIIPEWEPLYSTNPYMTGDKVTYNGKTWVSIIDNNIQEPGVYGWEEA